MGTLGALKARIATDLARGASLTTPIANAIVDAIDEYSDVPFYWQTAEADVVTVANTETVALPSGFRRLVMVSVDDGSDRLDLPPDRHQITYEEYRARNRSSSRGRPCDYALWNQLAYLDPVPDAVYTLTFSHVVALAAPASDGASNAWTTDAEQMIRAKAKELLFRDTIRNLEQAQIQQGAAKRWEVKHLSRSYAQALTYQARPTSF